MSIATLDIEIVQDPKTIPLIPEKQKGERSEPWDKLRFDSNFNIVCCIALYEGESVDGWSRIVSPDFGETELLNETWMMLQDYETIITFNGTTFDLPFLYKRSWLLDVQPSRWFDMKKYVNPRNLPTPNHIDLRGVLSNWDTYARGSLDLYAQIKLGRPKADGITGDMIQGLWDEGEFEKIRMHCEDDAKLTWELYESMKGYYF